MGKYDDLTRERLIELLEKRDRDKKLGLVWERDEIEADVAVDANFVACEIVPELSEKPAPWRNLVIEGDNYDALRWLRMTMAGRVKAIYIDPPYNTGNKDWVYNDHYVSRDDRYRHSTWLEFLYKRITLARDLLTEDGVILVSINDEQRAKLELLMDEALPGMRVGSFVWRTRTGGNEGGDHFFTANHEHVLVYGRGRFAFGGTDKSFEKYKYFDPERNDHFRLSDLTVAVSWDDPRAGSAFYPLHDEKTDTWYPCNPNRVWAYVLKERAKKGTKVKTKFMEEWIAAGNIDFPAEQRVQVWQTRAELDRAIASGEVPGGLGSPFLRQDLPDLDFWVGKRVGFGTPSFKRYKGALRTASQPLSSWIIPVKEKKTKSDDLTDLIVGTNTEGSKTVTALFGQKAFNYAKPPSLLRELLRQSTEPGDMVLDFFAGSATTAQAVMELNAEDGGDRQFIMVSSTEATSDEPHKNLCRDITAQRIRLLNGANGKSADLASEFAYVRTSEIDFEDLDYDLTPSQAWLALEAIHGLSLTTYDKSRSWNGHDSDDTVLVLVDTPNDDLRKWVSARIGRNLFVYAWAPGQVEALLAGTGVEVLSVRQTLVSRFVA